MTKELKRGVSESFAQSFNESKISKFYQDHAEELFLGIRNECVNLYYMGGSVCKVKINKGAIKCTIANKYLDAINASGYQSISIENLIGNYDRIKKNIEVLSSPEKVAQQKLVLNNNENGRSKWFCIDMEYVKQRNNSREDEFGRFDIIAVSKKAPYEVALIELKFGKGAIGGKSGVVKHAKDYMEFCNKNVFEAHLLDEIIAIIQSRLLFATPESLINKAFIEKITRKDFVVTPKIYFITLANQGGVARECMRRYLLDVQGASSKSFQKVHGFDITKENEKNFNPIFLFSDGHGDNIHDIIGDDNYDRKGLT